MQSSSGGTFSAFAEAILADGGIVYGAAYDENLRVHHIGVEESNGLPKLRGSKYVQSEIGDVFKEIKFNLKKDRQALFIGTPCQVAGLHSFLVKDYKYLLTADLICHGVPSPLVFKKYISHIEKHNKTVFRSINFRDKRHGWENILSVAISDSDKEYYLKGRENFYYNGFIKGIFLRESCYHCPFIGVPRSGDITFADFWGIQQGSKINQKEIDKGISLLMINHPLKSQSITSLVKDRLIIEERSFEEAKTGNGPMFTPSSRPSNREQFFADLNELDFESLAKEYLTPSIKRRTVQFLKENFPADSLVKLRKLKQALRL